MQITHLTQTLNPGPALTRLAPGAAKRKQPRRKVDFANLTYSTEPIYGAQGTFRLKEGVYEGPVIPELPPPDNYESISLVAVAYGDVTGDGTEEAMVVLTQSTRGTAIIYFVYVFAIEKQQPKLLWAFATGDRAQGGLRKVYSDQGDLVVELYGEGARVDEEIYVNAPNGCCCPTAFTRTRYRWLSDHFGSHGKSEVLTVNDAGDLEMEIQKPD